MFIKLLNEDEIKSCLDGIGKDTFKDGNKSQPLEDVKNNKESSREKFVSNELKDSVNPWVIQGRQIILNQD